MKKSTLILLVSVLIISGITSCKSKQKVVEISGATIEAKQPGKTTTVTETETVIEDATPVEETVRNEKFSLADGESTNPDFNNKYHVVVGSFSIKQNAKNLQSTLNKEGNNAMVVINEKGMYRVIISSYNEYAQARSKINQISNRFPDAWVLIQK